MLCAATILVLTGVPTLIGLADTGEAGARVASTGKTATAFVAHRSTVHRAELDGMPLVKGNLTAPMPIVQGARTVPMPMVRAKQALSRTQPPACCLPKHAQEIRAATSRSPGVIEILKPSKAR